MPITSNKFRRVNRILDLALDAARNLKLPIQDKNRLLNVTENILLYNGYANESIEKPVLVGNWNAPNIFSSKEDQQKLELIFRRFEMALEKAGATLEWPDSVCICDGCNKLIAATTLTGFPPWLKRVNQENFCFRCIAEDPGEYLKCIENRAIVNDVEIDLTAHGYQKVYREPTEIHLRFKECRVELRKRLDELRELGLRRIIFNRVDLGVMHIKYDIYAHEDEPLAFLG